MSDPARYRILEGPARKEIEVQASRFIAAVGVAEDEAAAQAFVAEQRELLPDASHHCWAYLVGAPGSTRVVGFSDDGEPHNSAGRPMLNVLMHCGVGDIVAVVTRYFGGTKLGRGGLVRAYGGALQEALREAATTERIDWLSLRVDLDYGLVSVVERLYPEFEVEVLSQDFGVRVAQRVRLPRARQAELARALADASRGSIQLVEED